MNRSIFGWDVLNGNVAIWIEMNRLDDGQALGRPVHRDPAVN